MGSQALALTPPLMPLLLTSATLPHPLLHLQRVWEGPFLGHPTIVKQRFSKKYRHPQLDAKLTVSRLKTVGGGLIVRVTSGGMR